MKPTSELRSVLSRREMLLGSGMGFASLALSQLLSNDRLLAAGSGDISRGLDRAPNTPHFPARAKAVIMLMQNGGPSQMELFDPKPALERHAGTVYRDKVEMFQPGSEGTRCSLAHFASIHAASAARRSRTRCRIWGRSPTTCASCARCTASTTTTPSRW
jgi:hypothetical protein